MSDVQPEETEEEASTRLYGYGAASVFDPVLCELAYRWFCPPGGTTLDPCAGGSVRGITASMLGRRYMGIDIRGAQVEANEKQAIDICEGANSFIPEIPEDFMPEVTPVELVNDSVWLKREDLYAFAGVRGAKVRTCMFFIQRAKDAGVGVVTAGARHSPQVNFVAQIAHRMSVKCRAHVPTGEMTPELLAARSAGADLIQHHAGYNTVIVARAREDAAESGWVEVPYGMESQEAVDFTKPQVVNLPDCKRIVNAVGSGMTLAGILWGLVETERDIPVLGVCVSRPPVERLDRHAPPNWRDMVEFVEHPTDYADAARDIMFGGVMLDPYYEAKCIDYIEEGDCLWVSAIRPSVVPAPAIMPEWITGDAFDMDDLLPDDFEADFLFTCPPYGDLEVYSDDPNDLSNMSYEDFLERYRAIIAKSCAYLKDDRFAGIVVGDFRGPDGMYRNFVSETIRAFEDAGLHLYNESILVTSLASLVLRVGKQFDTSRKMGKTHQNFLVFVKGDPRRATAACGPIVTADLSDPSEAEPEED